MLISFLFLTKTLTSIERSTVRRPLNSDKTRLPRPRYLAAPRKKGRCRIYKGITAPSSMSRTQAHTLSRRLRVFFGVTLGLLLKYYGTKYRKKRKNRNRGTFRMREEKYGSAVRRQASVSCRWRDAVRVEDGEGVHVGDG